MKTTSSHFKPFSYEQQWELFNTLLPFHGETGDEGEWTIDVLLRLVREVKYRREQTSERALSQDDKGQLVRRAFWEPGVFVQLLAVAPTKFIADRNGYADVFANDERWIVKSNNTDGKK